MLLQSAFMSEEHQWFSLLQIQGEPSEEQYETYVEVVEAINAIFDEAQYDAESDEPV